MKVHEILGDGNCLLNAILHQLHQNASQQLHCSVHELRSQVTNYIKCNLDNFLPTILDTCRYIYSSDPNLSESDYILKYLTDLEKDGFWCGAETLAAISELKNIKINIYNADFQHQVSFVPSIGHHACEIYLLFTDNHYDSLLLSSCQETEPLLRAEPAPLDHRSISVNLQRKFCATINPYTLIELTQPNLLPSPLRNSFSFRFGTWNIRGLGNCEKRNTIDSVLIKNNIDICSVQEINTISGACCSDNYIWYLSNKTTSNRRGVGILIRKNSHIKIIHLKYFCGFIITILGFVPNIGYVLFISVYVPPQNSPSNRKRATSTFSTLSSILDWCPKTRDVFLLGDFNAHLGSIDS